MDRKLTDQEKVRREKLKEISKTTTVLHMLIPIITILWWILAYCLSSVFADKVVIGIGCSTISAVCVIHTITTAILLIRDRNKIKD
mgnify:CR=1 FL=1